MTKQSNSILLGDRKRYRARRQAEYTTHDKLTREWLEYTEETNFRTIQDCIEILEKLREDYDKYYERAALQNAVRHLNLYLKS